MLSVPEIVREHQDDVGGRGRAEALAAISTTATARSTAGLMDFIQAVTTMNAMLPSISMLIAAAGLAVIACSSFSN